MNNCVSCVFYLWYNNSEYQCGKYERKHLDKRWPYKNTKCLDFKEYSIQEKENE